MFIKLVIALDLKEFFPGKLLMIIFGYIEIELLLTQNITIPNSINSVTVPQKYILHLLCDLPSVWQLCCLLVFVL